MAEIEIVTIAARPDLAEIAAEWVWREWARPRGTPLAEVVARMRARQAMRGPEQGLVLLDGGRPAGTACLVLHDLDARPDLSPWLANVFVHPDFRGRGHAPRLVRAVEASCVAAGVERLYLNSNTAVPLYARLGWVAFGVAPSQSGEVTLMRRDFTADGAAA